MLTLTKIFHFEMAHAINGYQGACKNIHGHSYELHVTVSADNQEKGYIAVPGFIIDFKELKQLVKSSIIDVLDHKLLLSRAYLSQNPGIHSQENLLIWNAEPTAENLLLYIQAVICEKLPKHVNLGRLRLYETKDSYAEWINDLF